MSQQIETFIWGGQTRFKCPHTWEGGAACTWNFSDIDELREHMEQPHNRTGKPAQRQVVVSPLVDQDGKPIVHERMKEPDVPLEFQNLKFKE